MSLVSQSREKLFNFSRSIEKIYGLRSLSKSQEVLNLYKNGSLMTSQENINNVVTEILKSRENLTEGDAKDKRLTRATTADLGVLRHRHRQMRIYSGSSTTSINSDLAELEEEDREADAGESGTNGDSVDQTEYPDRPADGVEEPRFTVAQLITAFNKHQEVVTNTSLEVTMSAQPKIPPVLPYSAQVPFPTGPTALRLFIPDIDLVDVQMKPKHNVRIDPPSPPEITCQTAPVLLLSETKPEIYLRSSSLSSDASTAVSAEDITPESSLEPIPDVKPPAKPTTLRVNSKRSKSQSPSPVSETDKTVPRKLSTGSYTDGKKNSEPVRKVSVGRKTSVERSPLPQRKVSVEKSPLVQRKNKPAESPTMAKKNGSGVSEFKIVGLAERNRKSHAISYKIEFASPVVTRRFPVRTLGVSAKSTISSELKKQDIVKPKKK